MAYRRKKSDADSDRRWLEWVASHREELKSIGLPPEVFLSPDHWMWFLEDGEVEPCRFPDTATGFNFSELSIDSMKRLLDFLRRHREFVPDRTPRPANAGP